MKSIVNFDVTSTKHFVITYLSVKHSDSEIEASYSKFRVKKLNIILISLNKVFVLLEFRNLD